MDSPTKWVWFASLMVLAYLPFTQNDGQYLGPNQTFIQVLQPNRSQTYWLTLSPGQVTWIEVDQSQVDVMIYSRPTRAKAAWSIIDSPDGQRMPERAGFYGLKNHELVIKLVTYDTSPDQDSRTILVTREGALRATQFNKTEADMVQRKSWAYLNQGRPMSRDNRLNYECRAEELFEYYQAKGDDFHSGEAALYLSEIANSNENYELSRSWAEQAIALWKNYAEPIKILYWAYNSLGRAHHMCGQYEQAIEAYHLGLAHHPRLRNARLLDNLGKAYFALSENGLAMYCHQQALALFDKEGGSDADRALTQKNQALVYAGMGQYNRALRIFSEVELAIREHDSLEERVWYDINRADILTASGDTTEAWDIYQQAMVDANSAGLTKLVKEIHWRLGLLALRIRDFNQADQTAALFRPGEVEHHYLKGMINLERALRGLGTKRSIHQLGDALEHLIKVSDEVLGENQRFHFLELYTVFALARTREAMGDLALAQNGYRQFFQELQQRRGRGTSGLERAFFADRWQPMVGQVLRALRQKTNAPFREGLEIVEDGRAGYLMERLTQQLRQRNFGKELAQETIYYSLDDQTSVGSGWEEKRPQSTVSDLRARIPRFADRRNQNTFQLELDRLVQRLAYHPETLVMVYAYHQESSFLWMIDQSGIRNRVLLNESELATMFSQARSALHLDQLYTLVDEMPVDQLRDLSQALFGSVPNLAAYRRLVIIGGSRLNTFPIRLLPLPGNDTTQLMGQRFSLSFAPSLTYMDWRYSKAEKEDGQATTSMAIIADPGQSSDAIATPGSNRRQSPLAFLAGVRHEVNTISTLAEQEGIQVTVFTGTHATREAILGQDLTDFDILHVAAHAEPAQRHLEEAAILLAPRTSGGLPTKLTLEDILELELQANLVVLSGCGTGQGIALAGEGTLSLGWAFLLAGARSVIVSLWPVEDQVTAKLMSEYYRLRLVAGLESAEALQAAQLSMSERHYDRDYRLGSAFIHLGDGLSGL